MPFAILGSLSEQEGVGLGKLQEAQGRKLTGTLMTGSDLSVHGASSFSAWFRRLIVYRTGQSASRQLKESFFDGLSLQLLQPPVNLV